MPDIIIRRRHFDKEVVRKLHVDSVNGEYIRGAVWGLQHAFDMQEYEIDIKEVEVAQQARAAARG